MEDSLAKIAGEREKIEREIAAAKQKAEAEETKRKAEEAVAAKLKEAEQVRIEAERKNVEEAARVKAEEEAKAKIIEEKKAVEPIVPSNQPAPNNPPVENSVNVTEAIKDNIISAELPAVGFEKNSYDLTPEMKAELKKAVIEMLQHPDLNIRIYSIASADETNAKQVSLKRSDAVLRFLIDNGVSLEKINSFYFGSNSSRNGCVNQNCPENLQKQNRTVTFQLAKPN